MTDVNIVLAVMEGATLVLGLVAGLISQRLPISEPMIALLAGVALGPLGFNLRYLAHLGNSTDIIEQFTRITLAIALMGAALRIPTGQFPVCWRQAVVLVGLGLPLTWLITAGLVYLIMGYPIWLALLIGGLAAPTDPVVANAIVTGPLARHSIPEDIRQTLSLESGINDGLAYPFVLLPLLLLHRPLGEALKHWFTISILWKVGGAVVIGALIGAVAGWLMRKCTALGLIGEESVLTISVALSLSVLALVGLANADGILAVFVAGILFNRFSKEEPAEKQERVQVAVSQLFTLPVFVILGMDLPWHEWMQLGWSAALLIVAVLLLRRLPVIYALRPFLGDLGRRQSALFMGWFGPVGVSAMFYVALTTGDTGDQRIRALGSLLIFTSIVIYGITATPFTALYGRYRRKHKAKADQESDDDRQERTANAS